MKSKSVIFFSILFLLCTEIISQPVINYYQGGIKEDYLPYRKKFILKGSSKLPDAAATTVVLRVTHPEGKDSTYVWRQPLDDKTNEFQLIVEPLKKLGINYDFKLEFYSKLDTSEITDVVNSIVNPVKDSLLTELNTNGQIKKSNFEKYFNSSINSAKSKYEMTYYSVDDTGHKKEFITIPPYLIDRLWPLFASISLQEKPDEISEVIENLIEDTKKDSKGFNDAIDKVKKYGLGDSDIGKLQEVQKNPETLLDSDVEAKLLDILSNEELSEKIRERIGGFLTSIGNIKQRKEELQDAIKMWETFNESAAKLSDQMKSLVKIQSVRNFTSESWGAKTDLDKIRIGTSYGYAGAALGSEFDAFSFVGLKFYIRPVDYDLPDPYEGGFFSHMAITLSAVFSSDVTYKGQKQADAFGGIKPMFGLSYDFIPTFVINAGVLIFRQPSINPLAAANRKNLKAAFYFGLSFDFDAINRLSELMKKAE